MVAGNKIIAEAINSAVMEDEQIWPSRPIIVLLDNIDRLFPQVQSELLMLMDGHDHYLKSKEDRNALRLRFIATTEADLEQMAEQGNFRKDLYYRLSVLPILLPPLRKRRTDVPLLVDYFLIKICANQQKSFRFLSDDLIQGLMANHWPDNIDDLEGWVHRTVMAGDESILDGQGILKNGKNHNTNFAIDGFHLSDIIHPIEIKNRLEALHHTSLKGICESLIAKAEKKIVQQALESTNWNRKRAAALLNISYKSILNKMKIYEIV